MQDNFKLTPTFTLEYGLRFEWNGTPVEGANRFTIFNPSTVTLTQVGTNGLAANAAYKQNYNWEPRLGFAWDLFGTGKSVLRGGYAYLVDQPVAGVVTGMASNPPFSTAVSYNGTAIPLSALYADAAASGIALYGVNPNYKNAYIESFNLNLQQALPWGLVAQLYYDGSVGRHLDGIEHQSGDGHDQHYAGPSVHCARGHQPCRPGGAIASNIGYRTSNSLSDYNAMWAVLGRT